MVQLHLNCASTVQIALSQRAVAGTTRQLHIDCNRTVRCSNPENSMEWRFYGPLLLAVLMFLLVGTIIERRLEVAIRRIMDQRQVMLRQEAEEINEVTSQTSTMTSSQRTPAPCRTQSTPVVNRQPKQDITVMT